MASQWPSMCHFFWWMLKRPTWFVFVLFVLPSLVYLLGQFIISVFFHLILLIHLFITHFFAAHLVWFRLFRVKKERCFYCLTVVSSDSGFQYIVNDCLCNATINSYIYCDQMAFILHIVVGKLPVLGFYFLFEEPQCIFGLVCLFLSQDLTTMVAMSFRYSSIWLKMKFGWTILLSLYTRTGEKLIYWYVWHSTAGGSSLEFGFVQFSRKFCCLPSIHPV